MHFTQIPLISKPHSYCAISPIFNCAQQETSKLFFWTLCGSKLLKASALVFDANCGYMTKMVSLVRGRGVKCAPTTRGVSTTGGREALCVGSWYVHMHMQTNGQTNVGNSKLNKIS